MKLIGITFTIAVLATLAGACGSGGDTDSTPTNTRESDAVADSGDSADEFACTAEQGETEEIDGRP